MLPFLNPKKLNATLMAARKPSGEVEIEGPEEDHALMSAAEDLLGAVKSGDAKRVAMALQSAYDMCSSSEGSEAFSSTED